MLCNKTITFTQRQLPNFPLSRLRPTVKYLQITLLYKLLILTVTILLSAPISRSQDIQEMKITASFANTPIQDAFNFLEKNYGIRCFYKDEWIKSKEVTKTFIDVPLVQVMNHIYISAGCR